MLLQNILLSMSEFQDWKSSWEWAATEVDTSNKNVF